MPEISVRHGFPKVQTTRGTTDVYDAYEYDARNRLSASCFDIGASPSDCTGAANKITYAYDKVSNRTQEVRSGNVGNTGTIDYTYNSADQLTQTSKGGTNTAYTYDGNGNQASAGGRTSTYNLADQLASTTNAGTTTTYGYDGDGHRVSSTVGGGGADIRSVWDPLADAGIPELALERTPAGSLIRRYLGGPLGAVSMTNGSGTFYYHGDPLGTITDLTDASGTAQWKYDYEAYGAERSATNVSGTAPENRLRFTGQYLDPETVLYHLRARQYDPISGQFDGLDPVENPLLAPYDSSYAYVNGRPTVLIDPLGLYGVTDFLTDTVGRVEIPFVDVPYLREASDFSAGFGDAVTFGGTRALRETIGANEAVNFCSGWYQSGQITGWTAGSVTAIGGGVRAAGVTWRGRELVLGSRYRRIAPFGNKPGQPYGGIPHYHRRRLDASTGQPRSGQGIGRHRPWEKRSTDTSFWDRF